MFLLRSVCLSVCPSDNWKSCERILTKFLGGVGHGPGTDNFNFGDAPDHRLDPGVRSPKSGFTGLSNYQRILMKFYWELGCGLETKWLHFGDDPHRYPDPGVRSGSRFGSGKNCHARCQHTQKAMNSSVMLAFGGGLCSLSTSSYCCYCCCNTLTDSLLRYWRLIQAALTQTSVYTLPIQTVLKQYLFSVF